MVNGWDDPRLLTLAGLRRRGFTPEAIRSFCDDVGVTRVDNTIHIERLDQSARDDLDVRCDRVFGILHPLKVVITNLESDIEVSGDNHPKNKERGTRKLLLSREIYIDRDDFREVDEPEYYGLALKSETPKVVKLKYADVDVILVDIKKDSKGVAEELILETVSNGNAKHAIHWISYEDRNPIIAEIRNYDRLFLSEEPVKTYGDKWLEDINPNSLEIKEGIVDVSCLALKPYDRIQFERIGFYCLDPDSTSSKLVFNRTLSLKQSTWKKQDRKEKK